jgi:hypothetical protein
LDIHFQDLEIAIPLKLCRQQADQGMSNKPVLVLEQFLVLGGAILRLVQDVNWRE